jgi:hypothetical protein
MLNARFSYNHSEITMTYEAVQVLTRLGDFSGSESRSALRSPMDSLNQYMSRFSDKINHDPL